MSERTEKLGRLAMNLSNEARFLFDAIAEREAPLPDQDWITMLRGLKRIDDLVDEAFEQLESVIEFPSLTLYLNAIASNPLAKAEQSQSLAPLAKPWADYFNNFNMHRLLAELRDAPDKPDHLPSEEKRAAIGAAIRGRKSVDDWVVEALSEDPMRFFMSRPEWCDFIAAKGAKRPDETSITKNKTLRALEQHQAKDPAGFESAARNRTGIFAPHNRG